MAIANVNAQALEAMKRSDHTLICFPEAVSGDGVGSALGLARALESLRPGHQVDVISSGFHGDHPQRYQFLPGVDRVKSSIEQLHDLTIRVPLGDARVEGVRHEVRDGALEIRLTPTAGSLSTEHIEAAMSRFRYDLVVVLDCADLTALGALYASHAAFFQSTPIIAIDHDPGHEHYGQINIVDLAASACGEVCAQFLREVAPACIDGDVATCLLAGILAETRSFRSPRMGVRTFAVTATLLDAGARRAEIVTALFQTRTVGQLQLWGRALTRLRVDVERKLVWTLLSQHDFLAAAAHENDLSEIIDELLVNTPDARVIILIYEQRDGTICALARSPSGDVDATRLLQPFGGQGTPTHAHACLVPQDLVAAERRVLDTVRKQM
ncbi:MAG: DHH family phosphoesterase [bacterium]|nr:DHH family phosphoesterase [bacterium]